MEEKPICVKCEFCNGKIINLGCLCEDSRITYYPTGEKSCHVLNYDGSCENFKPKE